MPHASAAASSSGPPILAGWSCATLGLTHQLSCIQASHQSAELGVAQQWRVCQEGAPREGVICGGLLQAAPNGRGTWQGRREDVNSCQPKAIITTIWVGSTLQLCGSTLVEQTCAEVDRDMQRLRAFKLDSRADRQWIAQSKLDIRRILCVATWQ